MIKLEIMQKIIVKTLITHKEMPPIIVDIQITHILIKIFISNLTIKILIIQQITEAIKRRQVGKTLNKEIE